MTTTAISTSSRKKDQSNSGIEIEARAAHQNQSNRRIDVTITTKDRVTTEELWNRYDLTESINSRDAMELNLVESEVYRATKIVPYNGVKVD